mmetsp:Transcript_341/g.1437  ORF Transcript_341/g.1437 Transcript_341/m.1437 type:complete len:228 (+) Transcript_341:738-1421(+)
MEGQGGGGAHHARARGPHRRVAVGHPRARPEHSGVRGSLHDAAHTATDEGVQPVGGREQVQGDRHGGEVRGGALRDGGGPRHALHPGLLRFDLSVRGGHRGSHRRLEDRREPGRRAELRPGTVRARRQRGRDAHDVRQHQRPVPGTDDKRVADPRLDGSKSFGSQRQDHHHAVRVQHPPPVRRQSRRGRVRAQDCLRRHVAEHLPRGCEEGWDPPDRSRRARPRGGD